ncbi:MAG TPA: MBL fold metallo-hydrolase [Smithellaceae bacterium]|jgi:glyoxylase-like metal-dependent hydrolase (beta-lactamase superfamily II)|nr:MBL fold metallo-hydrolase [Syntrophaceae bacterium]HPV50260.1 MBL fold metallo-hydrolase [Smithellaceae bacterium]
MLKTSAYEDVTTYKMGRSIGKYVPYFVHAFLVEDTLIDTGTVFAGAEFLDALKGREIKQIINTHDHEDHTGNNHLIQKKYGARIFAHRDSLPNIENPRRLKLRFYQKWVWGYPKGSAAATIGDTFYIGKQLFNVIPCAGHSAGHICLYEPDRKWLFTGDMFCGIRNIYLRRDENFHQILSSLENLSKLKIDTIFCSLKGAVTDGGNALSEKIKYMKNLRDKVLGLHQAGKTAVQIRNKLLGREDMMFFITGGHFSKQFLINNILTSTVGKA